MFSARRLEMTAGAVIALGIVGVPLWSQLAPHSPIYDLQTLDGCYEGEGLPDFIRPPRHWSLRITNGNVVSREEHTMSQIRLSRIGDRETSVSFAPGILVAGKPATVNPGEIVTGNAYLRRGSVILDLADELLLKTTCS